MNHSNPCLMKKQRKLCLMCGNILPRHICEVMSMFWSLRKCIKVKTKIYYNRRKGHPFVIFYPLSFLLEFSEILLINT